MIRLILQVVCLCVTLVYCDLMSKWIELAFDATTLYYVGGWICPLKGRPPEVEFWNWKIFTTRHSYASAVLGVIILSVRLSVTPVLCD